MSYHNSRRHLVDRADNGGPGQIAVRFSSIFFSTALHFQSLLVKEHTFLFCEHERDGSGERGGVRERHLPVMELKARLARQPRAKTRLRASPCGPRRFPPRRPSTVSRTGRGSERNGGHDDEYNTVKLYCRAAVARSTCATGSAEICSRSTVSDAASRAHRCSVSHPLRPFLDTNACTQSGLSRLRVYRSEL